jgi:hypothetical protein
VTFTEKYPTIQYVEDHELSNTHTEQLITQTQTPFVGEKAKEEEPTVDLILRGGDSWIAADDPPAARGQSHWFVWLDDLGYFSNIASAEENVQKFGQFIQDNHIDIAKNGASPGQQGQITTEPNPIDPGKSIEEVLHEWRLAVNEDAKASLDTDSIRGWVASNLAQRGEVKNTPPEGRLVRHVMTGRAYEVIADAKMKSDLTEMVVYRSRETGVTWVRPSAEFNDGRFVPVENDLDSLKQDRAGKQLGLTAVAVLPLEEMTEEDLMTGDRAFLFGSVRRGELGWSEPTWHQVYRMYTAEPLSKPNNWVTSGGPGENSYVSNRFTHFLRVNPPLLKKDPAQ